jgi:hypothetical protein
LWYGEGDFSTSIVLAVNGGYDTDCTAATVGATLGFILGSDGIPAHWSEPIGEGIFVGPGIIGISAPKTLTDLTERTVALIGKLERKTWDDSVWNKSLPPVDLVRLRGTICVIPQNEIHFTLWANGELPEEVKQAGGACWPWQITTDGSREIICLAREGARLFIDDKLIIECPAGLPYVPATHRSPAGSRIKVNPGIGTHKVQFELNSCNPRQEASVILAYPNLHIAPWTGDELPEAANLPDA